MNINLLNREGTRIANAETTNGAPPPDLIRWNGKHFVREPGSTAYREARVLDLKRNQATEIKTRKPPEPVEVDEGPDNG